MARMMSSARLFLAAIALSSTPALAGSRLAGGGELDLSILRIAMSLLLCLALAAAIILLLKRNGGRISLTGLRNLLSNGSPSGQRIRVIESRRISVHADLCVVRCDDVDYVILSSSQHQHVLRQTPAAEAPSE